MKIQEIYNELLECNENLYGELILHPKSNTIEWSYDGLSNPNIFNEDQLYDIFDMDIEIIKDELSKIIIDDYVINKPIVNNNTISFDIDFE